MSDTTAARTPEGTAGPAEPPHGSPYEAIRAIPVRHYGRWIAAVVVVAACAVVLIAPDFSP